MKISAELYVYDKKKFIVFLIFMALVIFGVAGGLWWLFS